jgi:hypothetical protein
MPGSFGGSKASKIYISVPDETDGFYVEVYDTRDKIIMESTWKATPELCKQWAREQGATKFEEC